MVITTTSTTAAHAVPRLLTSVIVRFVKPPPYVTMSFLECDIPLMSHTMDTTFSRLQRHSPPFSYYDTTSGCSQCLDDGQLDRRDQATQV